MQIKTIIIFVVVTLGVLLGVGGLLWQFGGVSDQPILEIAGAKNHVKGSGDITLVEFSDFQCPACLSVQAPLEEILKKYEGKVEFVYRSFPLTTIHKNAQLAAQAGEAASLQGKFWEMHDKLFGNQGEWSDLGDPREKFVQYASEIELDTEKFLSDIDSQSVKDSVAVDMLDASRYRLTGTPSFYVNGISTDFGDIEAKIQELSK